MKHPPHPQILMQGDEVSWLVMHTPCACAFSQGGWFEETPVDGYPLIFIIPGVCWSVRESAFM